MDSITIGLISTVAVLVSFGLLLRVIMSIRKCKQCKKRFWKWVGNPKKKKIYLEDLFFCEKCQIILKTAYYKEIEENDQSSDQGISITKLDQLSHSIDK